MLVDKQYIEDQSLGGLNVDFDKIDNFIRAAISMVEWYLDRPLEFGTYQQTGSKKKVWRPIVTPAEVIELDEEAIEVIYEGGWTAETLPDDIKMAIFKITVWNINKASMNLYGQTQRAGVQGGAEYTITADQRDFIRDTLKEISHHRNMQYYESVIKLPDED